MKKLFRKIFIYLPLSLILFICLLYFIVTSGFFLKYIGLPITGYFIGMPIRVENVNISFLINPHLEAGGLVFGDSEKPFIVSKKLSARFDLLSLLKGDLKLGDVFIDGADVNMALGKNGKWNLYWMNGAVSPSNVSPVSGKGKAAASIPMQLDISNAAIRNLNFAYSGRDICIVLKNFSLDSESFKNKYNSIVKVKGDITRYAGNNVTVSNGKIDTALTVNLNEEYFPVFLQVNAVASNFTENIKGRVTSDKSFRINALISPEDKNVVNISDLSIKIYTGDVVCSSLSLKGKVVLDPLILDLNIAADPIGSDTINLVVNSFFGTDVGKDASLVFNGNVSSDKNVFSVKGNLKLADLLFQSPVSSDKKELISAVLKYNLSIDALAKKADIIQLDATIDRKNTALINMSLQKPMSVDWKKDQIKVTGEDPEIIAKISDVELNILNEFLPPGTEFSSGTLNSNLKLKIDADDGSISMFGNINTSDVSCVSSACKLRGVNLNQVVSISLSNKRYLTLKKYNISLTQNGQKLVESSLSGKYDFESGDGELEMSVPRYNCAVLNLLSDSVLPRQKKKQIMSNMSAFSFSINNKQTFNIDRKAITIKDFLFNLQTEKGGAILLALDKPLTLNLGSKQLISEDLVLKMKAEDFDLKSLNGFLPSSIKIENGKVNIDTALSAGNMFREISTSGSLDITGASLKFDGNTVSKTDIEAQFNASLESGLLKVNSFNVSAQTAAGEKVFTRLSEPALIDLKNSKSTGSKIATNTKVENLDLKSLNSFFAKDTKFQKGVLNCNVDAAAEKDFKKISAAGTIMASEIDGRVRGNTLSKAGTIANFNIIYDEGEPFTLTDTIVKVFYEDKDAANISVNGTFDNAAGAANFETQIKVNEYLLKALNKTSSNYESVSSFLLDGNLKIKTSKNTFAIDGNVNMPKLTIVSNQQPFQSEQINGALDISIYKNLQFLNINSAKLNLFSNGANICDFSSNGKIVFSDDVQSTLNVSSEKIDLEKVLRVYALLFPSEPETSETNKKTVVQVQTKEPAPIDLQGINLNGSINFKDIQYGPYIRMAIASNLLIKNNNIALLPLIVRMNRGELKSDIYVNPTFANGYKYEIKGQLQNLDINPLLKTFIQGNYSDTKGIISFLRFNAKGKGIMSPNLLNNMSGNLSAECNNISLPLDISQNKFLALFMMPIQIISNISQQLPNTPLPSDLNQAMNITGKIISQRKNINFQTGDIMLKVNNGVINVEKFYFTGGKDDIIKAMKFRGTIGPDNKLSLKTNTNFGKLDIPLKFNGTVESPSPDIPVFIAEFIMKNTINILDVTQEILNKASAPQGSKEGAVQQLSNGVLNTAKGILGDLTGP